MKIIILSLEMGEGIPGVCTGGSKVEDPGKDKACNTWKRGMKNYTVGIK